MAKPKTTCQGPDASTWQSYLSQQRYKNRWYNQPPKMISKVPRCGKPISEDRIRAGQNTCSPALYCTDACRARAARERKYVPKK